MYEVIILEDASRFIRSLDLKMRVKTTKTIELLQEYGPLIREPYSKKMKGYKSIYELRIKLGSNIIRLFYFHNGKTVYVITSGFKKKMKKTNRKEIDKAVSLMKMYITEEHDD